jgi:4-methylaminobutanoate oxidase (formaldehyde-forming)
MPIVVAPDLGLYARRDGHRLLFGLREAIGVGVSPRDLPEDLQGHDFGGDAGGLATLEAAAGALERYAPGLFGGGITHYVSGPSTYSVDGEFIVGEPAAYDNLGVLGGCNGAGIAVSAGLARLACEITSGRIDPLLRQALSPDRVRGFDPFASEFLAACAAVRAGKRSA